MENNRKQAPADQYTDETVERTRQNLAAVIADKSLDSLEREAGRIFMLPLNLYVAARRLARQPIGSC